LYQPNLQDQRFRKVLWGTIYSYEGLPIGVLQEKLKVESESVEAIALGQWFQSRDHCESEVNRFPMLLEQYSNRLGCER